MIIILLGPPGAGKGTQSKMLAQKLKLPHISTGDILRQNVAKATDLGKKAKDFMEKGLLVPDTLVTEMLIDRFKEPDLKNGFILDGYPRTLNQAQTLDTLFAQRSMALDMVLYLDTSTDVILQRLTGRRVCKGCGALYHMKNMPPRTDGICDSCGGALYQRTDDKEETIMNRLAVYKKEVKDLIDYYQKTGALQELAADDDAGIVLDKIVVLTQRYNDSLKK